MWGCVGIAAAAVVGASEFLTWRASRDLLPEGHTGLRSETGEAVLVLGYPADSRGRLSLVQRWRIRIAVRSTDPWNARFVFTGVATRGGVSEARMMAVHAVSAFGIPWTNVVLEEQARSTWENIANSLPLLEDAPAIKIASNTFHARRARKYLADQDRELAARLRRARDFVPGELALLKPLLVAHEWSRARRERRAASGSAKNP